MRISDWSSDVCSSDLADLFANRHLGKPRLIAAVEQAVGILNRHHARAAPLSGEREETHHAPGILVGEADMAHLAGLPHRTARVQGFLDRRLGGAVLVPIPAAAELVGALKYVGRGKCV